MLLLISQTLQFSYTRGISQRWQFTLRHGFSWYTLFADKHIILRNKRLQQSVEEHRICNP